MSVIYICDSIERFHFFKRLIKAGCNSSMLLTTEPIVKILSTIHNISCFLVTKNVSLQQEYNFHNLKLSIDYLNSKITESDLLPIASSIVEALRQAETKYDIDTIVMWNGQQLIGRVASQYAIEHGLKRLFLEISNLPNKIFADPIGVNAMSSVMHNPKLEAFNHDDIHAKWIKEYIISKEQPLPQSQIKRSDKIYKAVNIILKKLFCGFNVKILNYNRPVDLSELMGIITSHSIKPKYVFLPLQVTSDTQIKLHSDYTNFDALIFALDFAKNKGVSLVVKLHPAETSQEFVDELTRLVKKHDFIVTNNNTVELIKNSESVITINSTVGLEAKIFGKEVIVLGRAFYAEFDEQALKSYIHNYLVDDIDYFSNQSISIDKVKELLAIAR